MDLLLDVLDAVDYYLGAVLWFVLFCVVTFGVELVAILKLSEWLGLA